MTEPETPAGPWAGLAESPSGEGGSGDAGKTGRPRERYRTHLLLFVATFLTTTAVGALHWTGFQSDFGAKTVAAPAAVLALKGLWYSVTLLAILGAHEFGHYLACRYHGVSATLPYFLPIPLPLTGTAGAFIRIRQPITSKAVLFDVGVAGPLAGFLVALPALFVGLALSRLSPLPPAFVGAELGEPVLFQLASHAIWGPIPDQVSLNLHPMAFAAWFGLLVTAINLFPIGQFDGGHIAYAVLGRRSFSVSLATVGAAIALCFYSLSWVTWTLLALVILTIFGWRHPPTWDEHVPLDRVRFWLALATLAVFVLCFTPAPIEPLELVRPR